jgi:Uma2 family endonuclease
MHRHCSEFRAARGLLTHRRVPAYTSSMRAVWIGVPEEFLEERRRLGHDKKDELWEGVLHMVPPPAHVHSRVQTDLVVALSQVARSRGLQVNVECGLFARDDNYRVPDVVLARREDCSRRGVERAELVVEVLSPDDESRDKLPFYASVGVPEVWLVEPSSRAFELLVLRDGTYGQIAATGTVCSPTLAIELCVIDGVLELRDGNDVHRI